MERATTNGFDFDTAADSQLANLKQAGHVLQLTRATLYRYNKQGILPFIRIGCQTRVRVADLRKLIAGGC